MIKFILFIIFSFLFSLELFPQQRLVEFYNLSIKNYQEGNCKLAIKFGEEALSLFEKTYGKSDNPDYALILGTLGISYSQSGSFDKAEALCKEALEMSRRLYNGYNSDLAISINNMGMVFLDESRYKEAEPLYIESLEMNRRLYRGDNPDLATSINNLAKLYQAMGRYKEAEPLNKEALEMRRRLYKGDNSDLAISINNMGMVFLDMGRYEDAEQLLKEALEMRRRLYQSDNFDLAQSVNNMAVLYQIMYRVKESELLLKEALEMRRRLYKSDNLNLAQSIYNMAALYQSIGRNEEAKSLLKEAFEMFRRLYKYDHPELAKSINNVATIYKTMGLYEEAESLYQEALEINRRLYKYDHPELAESISNIAALYNAGGRYKEAEPLYQEALEMYRRLYKYDHPDLAQGINNMAALYQSMSRYQEAESLFKKALEMRRRLYKSDHPDLAQGINNMAALYQSTGRYQEAESLFKEALKMMRRLYKDDHPDLTKSINNMAGIYKDMGQYGEAEPLFKESLEMTRRLYHYDNHDLAIIISNLAGLYHSIGRYKEAEPLYKESLEIMRRLYKDGYYDLAQNINNMAELYKAMGRYKEAEPLYKESLKMYRRLYKGDNSDLASIIYNTAGLYKSMKRYKEAEPLFLEALSTEKRLFNNNSYGLTEEELGYLWNTFADKFELFSSFVIQRDSENPMIREQYYNSHLFSKALLFKSTQKVKQQILSSNDKDLIKKYNKLRSIGEKKNKYGSLTKEELLRIRMNYDSLVTSGRELEKELSLRSEVFANEYDKKDVIFSDVRSKLNDNEAAIELIRIQYYDKHWTDTVYYAALIVTKQTKKYPEYVLIENGKELEKEYLAEYQSKNANVSQTFDKDVISYSRYWSKISEKLKGIKRVYISLDGVYNQISLQSLYNPETGKYLGEDLDLRILTSTKDLVKGKNGRKVNKRSAELFGNPSYRLGKKSYEKIAANIPLVTQRGDILNDNVKEGLKGGDYCKELPETEQEVKEIYSLLKDKGWSCNLYTDSMALEERVKSVQNPGILMISTHGYFLSDMEKKEDKFLLMGKEKERVYDNPLLRSGLILAGACNWEERLKENQNYDDGKLTANEVMNMNLDNTDLVVLSACETGLGEVRNGEGVYGLQRAFQQAGAKNVLMSLWKVNAESTKKLMVSFFKKWLSGEEIHEALKDAQNELRQIPEYDHPSYWSAFVLIGN